MNTDELREEIRRLGPWHHDVEVAPGIRTAEVSKDVVYPASFGPMTHIQIDRWMAHFVNQVYPNGFEGRSIMDCACNAGGLLFEAGRHGAGRRFGFDVREHWINQARFLARHDHGDMEFATLDIHSLPQLKLEPFDVTLFMGLFYHLPDPIASLRAAADLTREMLVVNTAYTPFGGNRLQLIHESQTDAMSGVHRLAWLPMSEEVLREILAWCGFPHVRVTTRLPSGDGWFHRIELMAARDESAFRHLDVKRPDASAPPPRMGLRRRLLNRLLRRR